VIVLGERHLRRLLIAYLTYYHEARTHLALEKDAPTTRRVQTPTEGHVWSRSRKLADFIIGTNATPPDRPGSTVDSTAVTAVYLSARSARACASRFDSRRPCPEASLTGRRRRTTAVLTSVDEILANDRARRKGKKRATCPEDGSSAAGEGRRISEGNWLAALDDFRNWLIREAA
jgi:hypothetical protein